MEKTVSCLTKGWSQSFLGHTSILKSKCSAKDTETPWTALDCTVSWTRKHTDTYTQHHQDSIFPGISTNPKSLGMRVHALGLLSPWRKTQGGRGMSNTLHYPQHLTSVPITHVNKYKLKSKKGRNQKPHSPINLLCNCRQAINFFVSQSVNKVSGFCSMGIYWCFLLLMSLNCKVLWDIWLLRCFRNAWLNYTQL